MDMETRLDGAWDEHVDADHGARARLRTRVAHTHGLLRLSLEQWERAGLDAAMIQRARTALDEYFRRLAEAAQLGVLPPTRIATDRRRTARDGLVAADRELDALAESLEGQIWRAHSCARAMRSIKRLRAEIERLLAVATE